MSQGTFCYHGIRDNDGILIASTFAPPSESVSEANAKLIAAAPDLLKALQILLDACYTADAKEELSEDVDGGILDIAQRAIRKATE